MIFQFISTLEKVGALSHLSFPEPVLSISDKEFFKIENKMKMSQQAGSNQRPEDH